MLWLHSLKLLIWIHPYYMGYYLCFLFFPSLIIIGHKSFLLFDLDLDFYSLLYSQVVVYNTKITTILDYNLKHVTIETTTHVLSLYILDSDEAIQEGRKHKPPSTDQDR